jgi:predicted phage terminase large subunit-like protein
VDGDQVRHLCRTSLDFLSTEILGFKDWDKVHDDIEIFLCKPATRKLLLVPRGHLKTSIVTKAYTIQRILRNPNIRILISNQVWDKSREMLFEIKELLTTKSDLPKIFGNFVSARWREDDIVVAQRTKALSAPTIGTTGVEAEMTSTHFDLILADDMQGLQNSITKEQRDKVERTYNSYVDLLDPGAMLIDIGTRWHQDDLHQRILDREAKYYDVMVRRVVEDGKIIFPKKFNLKFNEVAKSWEYSETPTMDYINYLKESKKSEFYSQYMNDPIDEGNQAFKRQDFRYWDKRPDRLFIAMTADPAIGMKQEADYFALNISGMTPDRNIFVLDRIKGHWQPYEAIDNIFSKFLQWRPSIVALETVGFQKTLQYALQEEMRKRNIFFPIRELKHGANASKELRIRALEPYFRNGMVHLGRGMAGLEDELLSFPKGRHDDELDALASQLEVLVPAGEMAAPAADPRSWQAHFERAKKFNSPYRDFFHEVKR